MVRKMNKIAYLAKFLIYAISDPKRGKETFKTKYQSMHNSVADLYDYGSKQQNLEEIIDTLFPNYVITIQDALKNTQKLQDHIADFFNHLRSEKYPSKKKPYPTEYSIDDKSGLFLYILCKLAKPELIVETGVAYGLSSMYILQAFEENKKGSLHSIDGIFSPWQTMEMIGSAIPSNLKNRWSIHFGSSAENLHNVLSSLRSVDIFFHDSLHTYKNMIFEYETAWPHIKNGGFLFSDDILGNNAFYDFKLDKKTRSFILSNNAHSSFGVIEKHLM